MLKWEDAGTVIFTPSPSSEKHYIRIFSFFFRDSSFITYNGIINLIIVWTEHR